MRSTRLVWIVTLLLLGACGDSPSPSGASQNGGDSNQPDLGSFDIEESDGGGLDQSSVSSDADVGTFVDQSQSDRDSGPQETDQSQSERDAGSSGDAEHQDTAIDDAAVDGTATALDATALDVALDASGVPLSELEVGEVVELFEGENPYAHGLDVAVTPSGDSVWVGNTDGGVLIGGQALDGDEESLQGYIAVFEAEGDLAWSSQPAADPIDESNTGWSHFVRVVTLDDGTPVSLGCARTNIHFPNHSPESAVGRTVVASWPGDDEEGWVAEF
ncbi:MAG: hypothetical protein KC561_18600, partial [Myxococcales bacterium]|nr:hypothetical protein [Myxococcales bacterium]